ncbi:MAG: MFS transporter [Anaerolineae bacterium]|nr:MFS transporter [Anaerolineae bacterium]
MPDQKKRLLTPLILWFMGTMILANIAAQMIMPLESLYVQELGASVTQVGIFFTVASIAPLLLQIFGGWLSDSIGRLQAIAIGSIAGLAAYGFYLFAPSWQWLLPASIFTAVAVSFVAPSFQAFIAEESDEASRGRVYGITSTMYMVVNIVGPILGGAIAQGLSFRIMYLVAACFYGVAAAVRVGMALYARRRRQQAPGDSASLSGLKKSLASVVALLTAGGVVTWIFISDGVRDVSFSLVGRLTPLFLENVRGLTLLQIGSLNSVSAIVAMIFMSPAGWLSDRKGERVGIVTGFALFAAGWLIFLSGTLFWHFVASHIVIGVGWALVEPAYSSLISKVVPDRLRGTAFGFFSTSLGVISLPAPWIGAWLWETVNPKFPFYVPLVALISMLPVMWIKFKLPANGATTEARGDEALEAADADISAA